MLDLRTNIINDVIMRLSDELTPEQLQVIKQSMFIELNNYEVQERCTSITINDNSPYAMLNRFIATKRIEGAAESTLKRYDFECKKLIDFLRKPLNEVTTFDLRYYLSTRKEQSDSLSNRTLDGMRRVIKSFFTFLYNEEIIPKNPAAGLAQIKYEKTIKRPYSAIDMEYIKRSCKNVRDRAIVEFLYGTGCRVSEMVALNRADVDFSDNSLIVLGKGGKERKVYLTEVTAMYLKEYLESRKDSNECLFAHLRGNHERLGKNGVEVMLKKL